MFIGNNMQYIVAWKSIRKNVVTMWSRKLKSH